MTAKANGCLFTSFASFILLCSILFLLTSEMDSRCKTFLRCKIKQMLPETFILLQGACTCAIDAARNIYCSIYFTCADGIKGPTCLPPEA